MNINSNLSYHLRPVLQLIPHPMTFYAFTILMKISIKLLLCEMYRLMSSEVIFIVNLFFFFCCAYQRVDEFSRFLPFWIFNFKKSQFSIDRSGAEHLLFNLIWIWNAWKNTKTSSIFILEFYGERICQRYFNCKRDLFAMVIEMVQQEKIKDFSNKW